MTPGQARMLAAALIGVVAFAVGVGNVQSQGPRPAAANGQNAKAIPPFKIFDDLYYIGIDYVCAYILKTSDGLIMIDTLYGDFVNHPVEAMRQLGLNPKDIKYVLVTHGHQDHFGGAKQIQEISGARVVMTDADWALMERGNRGAADSMVRRDIVAKDGETLKLGDTGVKFYVTPGHTPGVLSMEFTVHESGKAHKAFLFGGANVTSNRPEDFEMFISSVKRLSSTLSGIDVNLTSHPWQAGILERAEKLQSRKPGAPNPFVAPEDFKAFLHERLIDAETRLAAAKKSK
jgi:metallo-beta-lactamase class B